MDFQMPTDLRYLWRYMLHMYQLDAFTQSCPADQDIVNHYKQQQVCNNVRPAGRPPSPSTRYFFLFRIKASTTKALAYFSIIILNYILIHTLYIFSVNCIKGTYILILYLGIVGNFLI